jgi:RNA polymerase sigma factor (TIGR02999 family)
MSEITRILESIEGNPRAADELLPLVYEDLRRMAAHKMANEAAGHTLQPTALVHEAWLRLMDSGGQAWNGRNHFFMAAAEAMRRILVEHARRKLSLKRGGGSQRVDFDNLDLVVQATDERLLALDEALKKLAAHDEIGANLIQLRFFAGMSNVQAAEALGLSERTAKRAWAYARAWLYEQLCASR